MTSSPRWLTSASTGPLVIESFTPAVREIAKAVSLWRPLDAPSDELARGGARFLRESLAVPAAV